MGRRKKPVEPPVGSVPEGVRAALREDPKSRDEMRALAERTGGEFVPGRDGMQPYEDSIRYPAGTRVPEVREIALSRELLTIGEAHPCWVAAKHDFAYGGRGGEIVRVQPPEGASDEQVERVRTSLLEVGAEVVRVMPRRRSSVLTEPAEKREHASAREVVARLVEESNVEDRAALWEFVEGVMGRQGL
jgi:hypothetical protein